MTEPASFWDWAVAAYGREEVADICLRLQDRHDQNVPLLLWAVWASAHSVRIDTWLAQRGATIARMWGDEVITPLREVRRRLKVAVNHGDARDRLALRERVKATELEAEKVLMLQLEALLEPGDPSPQAMFAAIGRTSLERVHHAWSPGGDTDAVMELHQALTKG